MPHLCIDYSANLDEDPDFSINWLLEAVHQATIETDVFPLAGVRTRAVSQQHYRITDADPINAYVHLIIRIGKGRDDATKQRVGDHIFAALCAVLEPVLANRPLGISLEFVEIQTWKKSSLHQALEAKK